MPHHTQDLRPEFTDSYVSGLRDGNAEIQEHFAAYFSRELDFWLQFRLRDDGVIEDIRQETLRRVLGAIARENGLRDSHRLGPFVNRVCKNVLLEHWRKTRKTADLRERLENLDDSPGPERTLAAAENLSHLRNALKRISAHDRAVLMMLYFEERDRAEVSRRIGVNRSYLRVLAHRAILRLRASFLSCLAPPHGTQPIPAKADHQKCL
ncbi:MAG: RNA polymerase sigma factor [Bryobacteraceae bacterium]